MTIVSHKTSILIATVVGLAALSQSPALAQTSSKASDMQTSASSKTMKNSKEGGAKMAGANMSGKQLLEKYNTDGDDTFEMPEVMSLAESVFREINPDGDETLEPDETMGRLAAADFPKQEYPNNQKARGDKTVDLYQWLTIARQDFKTADTDHDGKVSAKELDAKSGRKLVVMIAPAR